MTNHNNARETSGDVSRYSAKLNAYGNRAMVSDPQGEWVMYADHTRTIKRLQSERDAALDAEYTTKDYFWQVYEKYLELTDVPIDFKDMEPNWKARAEAAEKRVAELESDLRFARREADEMRATDTFAALRSSQARIAELEADLQRAREALEPFAERAEYYRFDASDSADIGWSNDFTIGDLRRARAALKGKKP